MYMKYNISIRMTDHASQMAEYALIWVDTMGQNTISLLGIRPCFAVSTHISDQEHPISSALPHKNKNKKKRS